MKKLLIVVLALTLTLSCLSVYAADNVTSSAAASSPEYELKLVKLTRYDTTITGLIHDGKLYVNADNLTKAFQYMREVRVVFDKKDQADQESIIIQSKNGNIRILAYCLDGISIDGISYVVSDEVKLDRSIYYKDDYYMPLVQTMNYFGYKAVFDSKNKTLLMD